MNIFNTPLFRRMRLLVTGTFVVVLSIYAGVALLISSTSWWQPIILLPSMLAGIWAATRWDTPINGRTMLTLLALGEITWALSALFAVSPAGSFGIAVTGSVFVSKLDTRRTQAALGLVGIVATTGLLSLIWHSEQAVIYLLGPTIFVGIFVFVFIHNRVSWQLFTELDATRRAETEYAVMKEQFRFASDLHDIQGHTLHVVKLKVALAQKQASTAPATAQDELRQVQDLISETISQTRSLAYGQRKLKLMGELENAKQLFEAAAIEVDITVEGSPDQQVEELLSLVLREATTNILRHSQATRVSIIMAPAEINICNNGCDPEASPRLRGLANLEQRVEGAGGELLALQRNETFQTAAHFHNVK